MESPRFENQSDAEDYIRELDSKAELANINIKETIEILKNLQQDDNNIWGEGDYSWIAIDKAIEIIAKYKNLKSWGFICGAIADLSKEDLKSVYKYCLFLLEKHDD